MDEGAIHWPRVGLVPVLRAMEQALAEGRGFSLIRLGDGEGAVLAHDAPHMAEEIRFSLSIWFGAQPFSPTELAAIRASLEQAIVGADVLGLPRRAQLANTPRFAEVFAPVERLRGDNHPMIGDAALHFYLQWSGALGRLAGAAHRVVLIGCRAVAGEFAQTLGVATLEWLVRGEAAFPGEVTAPHWPDGYARIMTRITELEPGDLVLVGAGVLGKAYCEAARRRGAVAVDLGSVFDGWAGVMSRAGRIDEGREFSLGWLIEPGDGDHDGEAAMMARLAAIIARTNIADGVI